MRKFFRLLLLGLVLVTVFLISAMTAMRLAIHGREVVVPPLVGLAPSEAEHLTAANGLLLNFENRFYSSTVAEDRILSQLPAAGEKVRRGWRVRVAVSLGPQRVVIPDVVGQSPRAAEINLKRRGLELGTLAVLHLANAPADQVVAQSPPANAAGVVSPKVNLLLTASPDSGFRYYLMPDFVGRPFGDATSAMADAGFRVGEVTVVGTNSNGGNGARLKPIATDVVAKQYPPPGQKIGVGAAINFELLRQP